ncbi:MAG: alpha/beta hydrolase [Nitrospiraceae bacterium]
MSSPFHLVLLPGLDGTDVFFRPLVRALPSWIQPHVLCFPTTGASDYPTLVQFATDALHALPHYYVLGLSFSGPLALMLAAAHPERVQGVILASTFVRPPRSQYRYLRFAAVTPLVWALRASRRLPLMLSTRAQGAAWRDKCETWSRVSSRMVAARMRAVLAVDAREPLRTCPQPVLCLAGRADRVVPFRNVDDIVRIRPSTAVQLLEGDHFALYTHPQSAAQAIARFMDANTHLVPHGREGDLLLCDRNLSSEHLVSSSS